MNTFSKKIIFSEDDDSTKFYFVGGSWALKGYTDENYQTQTLETDYIRLATFWNRTYELVLTNGKGNLDILDQLLLLNIDPTVPIFWIYVEPGRDYGRITGRPEFEWMTSEDCFKIRESLTEVILKTIKSSLPNPIALIGGDSDIDPLLAESLGYFVLHPSWCKWTAEKLNSQWFKFGWGAADVGWRMHSNYVKPSKAVVFAWDELIKEYCWWEEHGYFCHEHPTPKSNEEFGKFLKPMVDEWLKNYE